MMMRSLFLTGRTDYSDPIPPPPGDCWNYGVTLYFFKGTTNKSRPVEKNSTGLDLFGSPGRARTADLVINNRLA